MVCGVASWRVTGQRTRRPYSSRISSAPTEHLSLPKILRAFASNNEMCTQVQDGDSVRDVPFLFH
jgi:hypothetical protein